MSAHQIIEPGSLDFDEVRIRLGGVETHPYATLVQHYSNEKFLGNKYVVAEHFVSPESGTPVDADIFDHRTMCYSLFAVPVGDSGRHKNVIPYHVNQKGFTEKTGLVVGGGLVRAPNDG